MSGSLTAGFRVDQPRPDDLVGNPLLLAGSGGGFEATIEVRVLDGTGAVLLETFLTSTNLISAWQLSITLPDPPPTPRGVVQVGPSTGGDESPAMVSVPVFFGTAIVPGFRSYFLYTVQPGDTLSRIAVEQAPLCQPARLERPRPDPSRDGPAAALRHLKAPRRGHLKAAPP
jgi:hypothetical protein